MARPRSIPTYRRHRQSGQAVVTLTDQLSGRRKDVLLGTYGSRASKEEYGRIIQQWEASKGRLLDQPAPDLTINELILSFVEQHVATHYRDADGKPTSEQSEFKGALKPLRELFGRERAAEFGPLKLKAVRGRMVNLGWSRRTVNQRSWRVKKMFRWAVENELIPPSVFHGLQAVAGLQLGRTPAPESAPILPVPAEHVDAILPFLPPTVHAMVKLQRLTGMRPGEVVILRPCDIDRSGTIWLYRPKRHKNTWRGKERIIALGPRAKLLLLPFLNRDPEAYCFQPLEAMRHRWQERRQERRTKVQPSQLNRRVAKPKRKPGECYDTQTYGRAIRRACVLANVPVWAPNQLRHLVAVELRERFGLEVTRAMLGHSFKAMSDHYSKTADAALAGQAAAEVG